MTDVPFIETWEEEEETAATDEEPEFVRNRFEYQWKRFGHESLEDPEESNGRFGHKKYADMVQFLEKRVSVCQRVRGMHKWHKTLEDSEGKKSGKKSVKLLGFMITVISVVVGSLITRFHTPASSLQKITDVRTTVSDKVASLSEFLGKSNLDFTMGVLMKSIEDVGKLMNESSLVEMTVDEIRKNLIVSKMWSVIGNRVSNCGAPQNRYVLKYVLYFLHDLVSVGGDMTVNKGLVGKMFQNCYDVEDVNDAVFSMLMATVHEQNARDSLSGVGKPIATTLVKEEFGPWSMAPMRFFAIWSQLASLGKADEEAVCQVVDWSTRYQDMWKRDFNAMICLISKNLKCPVFERFDMTGLYKRDECREVFAMFPRNE